MAMRMTGLISGMDTESVIQELVAVRQQKVDAVKKEQTSLKWKQEAWKDLNSKIYKLYTSSLSEMRFSSAYSKRITKVSNESIVSVITGDKAVNGVQSLEVESLAKTGYLTGKELSSKKTYSDNTVLTDAKENGGLGIAAGSSIAVKVGDSLTQIKITEGMTIGQLTAKLQSAGVNASFDANNQRFFISSKDSGKEGDFVLAGVDNAGVDALISLGIGSKTDLQKFAGTSGTAPQEEIDATVEKRLENILTSVTETESKVSEVADKVGALGVEDVKGKTAAEIKAQIEAFKETEDYDKLSDAQKKKLTQYTEELTKYEEELAEYAQYYETDANGNKVASSALVTEVTEELNSMYTTLGGAADYAATLDDSAFAEVYRTAGEDAVIYLNGARFTSDTNSFEINGLTLTVNSTTKTGEVVTISTEDDTEGIYDMIKDFFKQYNELIIEMDKLYNADAAKDYEPLTEDEKAEMSEEAIEKWEQKIKDAILRKDSTINSVSSALKEVMMSAVTMKDGSQKYLSEFGIETLSYFLAPDNEKGAYHIAGDPDDAHTSTSADKLKTAIANDPDTVIEFFTNLSRNLYSKLGDLMKRTEYSSAYTVYNDKSMQEDYNDYTTEIKELEAKLQDYEDKWYQKFAAMETALAKLQSNSSAVTSLLGG